MKKYLSFLILVLLALSLTILTAGCGDPSAAGNETDAANGNEETVTLMSVSVNSLPDKTVYYEGETLDFSGLTLLATYSDGTSRIVTDGFACAPESTDGAAGDLTVTVTHEGATATYGVTVMEMQVRLAEYGDGYCVTELIDKSAKNVTIPESYAGKPVVAIGEKAFCERYDLESVTIPDSVTSIGKSAFGWCTGLKSVAIPSGVTAVGNAVFQNCASLDHVTIPSGVTSIGYLAFADCANLKTVSLPSSVTSIGGYAFYGCKALTDVTIPSGVTIIEEYTFALCQALASVELPSGLTAIEETAFYCCHALESVTIPSGVTSIGDHAFDFCLGLTNVTIMPGVTSIGGCAFKGCEALKSLTLPSTVTNMGETPFGGCKDYTVHYDGTPEQWEAIKGSFPKNVNVVFGS